MASLKDVAIKAGVSTATVSRVINNHENVSWEVRRLVHTAMNDLSYLPNKSSISLEGKRSGLLGCVVPNLTNPHFSELIMVLEQEARFFGMDLIVKTHLNQPKVEQAAINSFISLGVEGLFWVPTENENELVDDIRRSGIFTVVVTQRSKFFNSILVDYRNGMVQVASHLKAQGWSKVGFIGQKGVDVEKYSVLKESFEELPIRCSLDSECIFWLPKGIAESINMAHSSSSSLESKDSAYGTNGADSNSISHDLNEHMLAIVKVLLERKQQGKAPIALWIYNDVCSLALEQECLKSGLRIPEDVGLISFDNTYLAQILNLSSISQPITKIAKQAYQLVAQAHREHKKVSAEHNESIECLEIKPELFARQSSKLAKI